MEKNINHINKDIHYFCKMRPIQSIFGIGFTSSSDALEWFECYVDEERYKVEDNYKITLRAIDGRAYEHYYQSDFLHLMWEGFIVPKTSDDIHVEYVSFDEPIPNTIAYIHHEGQLLVGTFDKIKVGDKVRIRFFSFVTTVTQIDYDRDFATVIWTDDKGNVHSETNPIDEYVKIV